LPQRRAIRHLPLLLVSAVVLLGQGQPASRATVSNAGPVIAPPAPSYRSPLSQTLNYAVEWRLFDAGVASIRIEPAGREQRIVSTADARGVVGLLYHVHDRFESFTDPQTNCSRSIEKRTEEGFRRLETNIVFDPTRKKSVLAEKNLKANTSKRVENDIPGCVTDVNAALFYIASQPLSAGATMLFPLNDGGKTVDVKVTVEAREEIKVPAGTYKTVRVLAVSASNPAKSKGQVQIWYTDDERHLPVQMKAKLFWGSLTFRLK
jgi:hypothetical protein